MADIGMCFQAPLVRAFLAGLKSQTRRTLSAARCLVDGHGMSAKRWAAMDFDWDSATIDPGPSPAGNVGPYLHVHSRAHGTTHRIYPRPQVGDRMWVREAWAEPLLGYGVFRYRASADTAKRWRPGIHMPRWAARIERDIVGLRFERLHDISEADALAEGVDPGGPVGYIPASDRMGRCRYQFANLWNEIHGAASWDANPMLLVYDFAEVKRA